MQSSGDKRASNSQSGEACEVVRISDASRSIDLAVRPARLERGEPFAIRPGAAADFRQRHRYDALWPERGALLKLLRAEKALAVKVERKDCSLLPGEIGWGQGGREALAADDADKVLCGERLLAAAIEPELYLRESRGEARERSSVADPLHDGVEIGDINRPEGMQTQEPFRNVARIARCGERASQGLVLGAPAGDGAHGLAAHEIDDGDYAQRNLEAIVRGSSEA